MSKRFKLGNGERQRETERSRVMFFEGFDFTIYNFLYWAVLIKNPLVLAH